jgi:TatD DNase family protein
MITYVDSHTHIDHCLEDGRRTLTDAAHLVATATQAGVTTLIQSGTDVGSSLWAVAAASQFPQVWATVGFHPHDAKGAQEDALGSIAALTAHPRVIGVGEVGLDYHWDNSPRDTQREIFVWMLELAEDASLPVVVHSRDAEEDTLTLLDEHARGLTVVMHCFSMPRRVEELTRQGYYLSFAGNVTYKNATDLQEAARRVPAERLLIETDAPYLTPEPRRGRSNSPAQVVETYRFVAELRGVPVETLASQVRENVGRAFPRVGAVAARHASL